MKTVHAGVTGTQIGMTHAQIEEFDKFLSRLMNANARVILHHGDCIGADAEMAKLAKFRGIQTIVHPPLNESKRMFLDQEPNVLAVRDPLPYLDRNVAIVDETTVLFGAPKGQEVRRSGTWSTIRYAVSQNKNVLVAYPDGHVVIPSPRKEVMNVHDSD